METGFDTVDALIEPVNVEPVTCLTIVVFGAIPLPVMLLLAISLVVPVFREFTVSVVPAAAIIGTGALTVCEIDTV